MAKQTFRAAGKNHSADIKNANRGTKGTNITYDKNQGNRDEQLNPKSKKGYVHSIAGNAPPIRKAVHHCFVVFIIGYFQKKVRW